QPRRRRRSARGGVGRVRAGHAPAPSARRPRPPPLRSALELRGADLGAARGHAGRAGLRRVPPDGGPRGAAGRRARRTGRERARGGSDDAPVGAELPLGEGVAGKVARVGEASLVDDGAVVWLPIRVEDRIIGVVNLAKGAASPVDPRAFSPMDLQFLSTLMAHVAYALENARLLEDARLNTERLQTVVEDLRTAQTRLVEGETVR